MIVMERSGDWAAALRLQLDPSDVRLFETRTLDECWLRLVEHPAAMAVLELTADNVRPLLTMLLRLQRALPEARAIVVAKRQLVEYGCLVREAGAIHFRVSTRSLADVADVVRRRAIQLEALAAYQGCDTDDPQTEIFAKLPWSDES